MGPRMAALVALSAGCFVKPDRPGGASGDGGASDGASSNCTMPVQSGFPGSTPCVPWGTTFGSGAMIMQSAGMLTVTPPPNLPASGGCHSVNSFQLEASGVFIEVDSVLSGVGAGTTFDISDAGSGIGFHITAAGATLLYSNDNTGYKQGATYVPSQMRWWRFRAAAGVVVEAEVAADGRHWSSFATEQVVAPGFVTVAMHADVSGVSNPAPGTAVFRNFDVCPN